MWPVRLAGHLLVIFCQRHNSVNLTQMIVDIFLVIVLALTKIISEGRP